MLGRVVLALLCLVALVGAPGTARAQVTSSSSSGSSTQSGTESIASPVANPNRFLFENGAYVNVTNTPRPLNLNPEGVNYTDCLQDLELQFPLVISGFQPGDGDHIEVWAGAVDCTQDANRSAVNAGVAEPCWQVAGKTGPLNATSTDAITMTVFARDVLRFEQPPAEGTNEVYDPTFHNGPDGEQACRVQTSDAAVPLSIYFLPVNSSEQAVGTAYQYAITTDLVAPPAPSIQSVNAGDTLITVVWVSPGDDPDIAGFAVWSDPPAGGSTTGGCSCGATPGGGASSYIGDGAVQLEDATLQRCIDAAEEEEEEGGDAATDGAVTPDVHVEAAADGAPQIPAQGDPEGPVDGAPSLEGSAPEASTTDGAADATSDATSDAAGGATSDAAAEAGPVNCNPINYGGGDGGACNSYALTGNVYVIGGGATMTSDAGDAATVVVDEDASGDAGVALAGGGISSIPPQYKAGEIDDISATQLTLTGLTNHRQYVVVVTCIDGSGNVGPVSTPSCAEPAPTNDFWGTYKSDGGDNKGCALGGGGGAPAFAVGFLAVAAAMARRRRR